MSSDSKQGFAWGALAADVLNANKKSNAMRVQCKPHPISSAACAALTAALLLTAAHSASGPARLGPLAP